MSQEEQEVALPTSTVTICLEKKVQPGRNERWVFQFKTMESYFLRTVKKYSIWKPNLL